MFNFILIGILLFVFVIFLSFIIGLVSSTLFGFKIGAWEAFETGMKIAKYALFWGVVLALIAGILITNDVIPIPDAWIQKDRWGETSVMAGFHLYFACVAIIFVPWYIAEIVGIAKFQFQFRELLQVLYEDLITLDERIDKVTNKIKLSLSDNPVAQRLMKIIGIGPLVCSALLIDLGDGMSFKRGRDFSTS